MIYFSLLRVSSELHLVALPDAHDSLQFLLIALFYCMCTI